MSDPNRTRSEERRSRADEEKPVFQDKGMGETGHPAAQVPLSAEMVEHLGDSATDYAQELWSLAQDRDADLDTMTASITAVNERFGVITPETVVVKWAEIFRNSGGLLTIICDEAVLAGAMADASAYETPHYANAPDESTDTAG